MTVETVRDNVAASRFELAFDGGVAFVDYTRSAGARVLTHAEVPIGQRGRGIGLRLAAGTLQLLRAQGEKVVPRCRFMARFMERHREYADLLAPAAATASERR
jgi:predicted GNAT family acetyltransferase